MLEKVCEGKRLTRIDYGLTRITDFRAAEGRPLSLLKKMLVAFARTYALCQQAKNGLVYTEVYT